MTAYRVRFYYDLEVDAESTLHAIQVAAIQITEAIDPSDIEKALVAGEVLAIGDDEKEAE